MKTIITILAAVAFLGGSHLSPCRAQDAPVSTTTVSQLSLGNVILNGPLTAEDLKGKVVAVEKWGIN